MSSRAAVLLAIASCANAQGPAVAIDISVPDSVLVLGSQTRLRGAVRDNAGAARSEDGITWRSSDEAILKVDAGGNVTAAGLGLAQIIATTGVIRWHIELQVVPAKFELTPPSAEMAAGESVQFAARALDINGEPAPLPPVLWELLADSSESARIAAIDATGRVTAAEIGKVRVRARIVYPFRFGKPTAISAEAAVTIREIPAFRLRRLLTSAQTRPSFQLRPTFTGFSSNDAGQIAWLGSLDGLATGLLRYTAGRIDLLTSGGIPAVVSGRVVTSIGKPSINARGDILAPVSSATIEGGTLGGLYLHTADSSGYVLLEGTGLGDYIDLSAFATSGNSLEATGGILFKATFREPEKPDARRGFFTLRDRLIELVLTEPATLPGLAGPATFDDEFAVDGQGGIVFAARSGTRRALYAKPAGAAPGKIIAIGDAFSGQAITRIEDIVFSPSGDVAFRIDLANGRQHLVRRLGSRVESKELIGSPHPLAVNARGDVLFTGSVTNRAGLYRWTGDVFTAVLLDGAQTGGLPSTRFVEAASISSAGAVTALVRTADNGSAFVQPGAARPLLFQNGLRIDLPANLHIRDLVQGVRAAPPYVLLGEPASVFETGAALQARAVLGDVLAGNYPLAGVRSIVESPAGDLLFSTPSTGRLDGGLFRYAAGQVARLMNDSQRLNSVTLYYPEARAANSRGTVVVTTGSDAGDYRTFYLRGAQLTQILSSSLPPKQVALDDSDRVMAFLDTNGFPPGYYLYNGTNWQPVLGLNDSRFGAPVVAMDGLRANGNAFVAIVSLGARYSQSAVVQFDSTWRTLLASGERLPTGGELGYVRDYDVNAAGDVAFITVTQPAGVLLLGVKQRGVLRTVATPGAKTPDGDLMLGYLRPDLRADGRIYFAAVSVLDEYLVYAADPI